MHRLTRFRALSAANCSRSLAEHWFDRAEITGEFIDLVVSQWLAALAPRYDHCE